MGSATDILTFLGHRKHIIMKPTKPPIWNVWLRKGMMFTQAYACNISSATRCSLITGADDTRHRVTNWTLEKNKATDRPSNTIQLPDWNYNGVSQVTGTSNTFVGTSFVELLRQNGYHTIHCGKLISVLLTHRERTLPIGGLK